jgi:hypothetical protein
MFGCIQAQAQFPLPVYEPFPLTYTNAPVDESIAVPQGGSIYPAKRLSNGGSATLWSIGGAAGGGSALIVGGPAAQSYLNLATNLTPSAGLYIRTNNTTATRSRGILYTTTSSGSLYTSFLVNAEQAPSPLDAFGPNRLFAKLDNATSGNGSSAMAGVWLTSSNTLAISKSSNSTPSADTGTALTPGTHLVVLRYTFHPDTGDDEVAMWVDPTALAVSEGSVPVPTLTTTNGTDVASFSSFYVYHIGNETVASIFLDEIRIGTSWADVTPTGIVCNSASIVASPTNQTLAEGLSATLAVLPGGSSPSFQWQSSTDSGTTWNNTTGTNQSYRTPVLAVADSGTQFRAIVTAGCNGTSATSAVATVTVTAAVPTPNGLVMGDEFLDGSRFNLPYATNNSIWVATAGLDIPGPLVGTPQTGSAVWMGFFTDDQTAPPGLPVHLNVGQQIKATILFSASGIVASGGNSMRLGLFDYLDGGIRPTADGSGVANSGVNVRGYMLVLNFGTTFGVDTPLAMYARNNLSAADLMGTTGNYESFGSGPENATLNGTPSFTDNTTNVVELTVFRTAADTVQFTTAVTNGAGVGWTHSVTDSTYAYPRFDTFAIRPNSLATTANNFTFHLFKVEVGQATVPVLPFNITEVQRLSPTSVKLTWESVSGKSYQIHSTPSLSPVTWTTNDTVVATGTLTSYTNAPVSEDQKFYRVVALP